MSLSIYYTHTHSLGRMSERGEALSSEREREQLWRSSFLSLGFINAIGDHFISEEVTGFLLYGFPGENSLCLLSLVIFDVHVILSDKILYHIT